MQDRVRTVCTAVQSAARNSRCNNKLIVTLSLFDSPMKYSHIKLRRKFSAKIKMQPNEITQYCTHAEESYRHSRHLLYFPACTCKVGHSYCFVARRSRTNLASPWRPLRYLFGTRSRVHRASVICRHNMQLISKPGDLQTRGNASVNSHTAHAINSSPDSATSPSVMLCGTTPNDVDVDVE